MKGLENWPAWGIALLILGLTALVAQIANKLLKTYLKGSSKRLKMDPTRFIYVQHLIISLIWIIGIIAAIYAIPSLRTVATSMLAGAGVFAVAISFAAQKAISNLISGLFIIIFKPFGINDLLQLKGSIQGRVEDITLRHTVLRNIKNERIIVPNAVINDEILVNSDYLEDLKVSLVELTITYQDDLKKAKNIFRNIAQQHPLSIDARTDEEIENGVDKVVIRVIELNSIGVALRAYVKCKNPVDAFALKCDVLEQVKQEFGLAKINFATANAVSEQ